MANSTVILELKEAITGLTDYNQTFYSDASRTNGVDAQGVGRLFQECNKLSNAFSESSPALADGWSNALELFRKIFEATAELLHDMYSAIDLYTDESYQAELILVLFIHQLVEVLINIKKVCLSYFFSLL